MHAVPARSQCASDQCCRTAEQTLMLTVAAWVPPLHRQEPQSCYRHLCWCQCRLLHCRTPRETRDIGCLQCSATGISCATGTWAVASAGWCTAVPLAQPRVTSCVPQKLSQAVAESEAEKPLLHVSCRSTSSSSAAAAACMPTCCCACALCTTRACARASCCMVAARACSAMTSARSAASGAPHS